MPRDRAELPPSVAVIVLAAGRARRFQRGNKLFSSVRGRPLLSRILRAACDSSARPVIVVSGHQRCRLVQLIRRFQRGSRRATNLREVFNRDYRRGMSGSLNAGIFAVPEHCAGAVICLGDMPRITAATIDALINAFQIGDSAVIPVVGGRRGNPVLLSRGIFSAVSGLTGDQGARRILMRAQRVREVEAGSEVLLDVDTRRDRLAWLKMRRSSREARY